MSAMLSCLPSRLGAALGARPALCVAALLVGAQLVGCGGGDPHRYEVSGTVTYGGEPVPGGRILFVPDPSQGNSGVGSVAEIHNGRFQTRSEKGAASGPHVVTIFGTDGSLPTETRDNALFPPYTLTVDLPSEASEHDFVVPQASSPSPGPSP